MINTWETTISKLKERDDELVQEEMKNVDIKEELIAREQIIKGTASFTGRAMRFHLKLMLLNDSRILSRQSKPCFDWLRGHVTRFTLKSEF